MDLATTIRVQAGGPGSGCCGSNCSRPKGVAKVGSKKWLEQIRSQGPILPTTVEGNQLVDQYLKMAAPVSLRDKLLLENGQHFESSGTVPKYGPAKMCYMNAFRLAQTNPTYRYAEGYVVPHTVSLPLDHAWVVDKDNKVIDPTLKDGGAAYYGVKFQPDYVSKVAVRSGMYGILSYTNPQIFKGEDKVADWKASALVDAGGPGSGCHGDNCGRPKSGKWIRPDYKIGNDDLAKMDREFAERDANNGWITQDGKFHSNGRMETHEQAAKRLGLIDKLHPDDYIGDIRKALGKGAVRLRNDFNDPYGSRIVEALSRKDLDNVIDAIPSDVTKAEVWSPDHAVINYSPEARKMAASRIIKPIFAAKKKKLILNPYDQFEPLVRATGAKVFDFLDAVDWALDRGDSITKATKGHEIGEAMKKTIAQARLAGYENASKITGRALDNGYIKRAVNLSYARAAKVDRLMLATTRDRLKMTPDSQYILSKDRSLAAARYETGRAYYKGVHDAFRGTSFGKVWNTASGDPCEECVGNEAEGVIPVGDDFGSGDSYPPSHILCACSVAMEPGG